MLRQGDPTVLPCIPENIQADGPVGVDVWVVDLCREGDLGWLEGVIGGEVDGEEEDPALVGTVRGSHNGGLQESFDKK